jgi:hypothetical protein
MNNHFYRKDKILYKPDIINFKVDFCKMMEIPVIAHPLFGVYFGVVKKFTPNLHKCSIKKHEEIMLRNFTVDNDLMPTSVFKLEGQFRLDIIYYNTKIGENAYYIRSRNFITIHTRNPYKKRTKAGKN